jgi:tetratricopeptide (TPR) repeat protein
MAPEGFGGDVDGAIEDLEFVVQKDPCHESYYYLGIAYKRKGLTDKAKKAFKKSLEIKPDYAKAATALAEL